MSKKLGVIAAVAAPHAPQMLSLPETEDHDQVNRVKKQLEDIGAAFSEKEIDVVIVISNDHGDHFVTHSVPPFCVHVGKTADGMHKHRGPWALESDLGFELVTEMSEQGFDLAYTVSASLQTAFTIPYAFMGFEREHGMLPIFVNAYMPPQPSGLRCYAFGQALDRALCRLGKRALLVASGGFSHFPGTDRYSEPDVETDRQWFDRIREGELRFLASLSDQELDRSGNVELRSLQILAGALGDCKPFAAQFEPSWHHTYVTFAWDPEQPASEEYVPAYPRLSVERTPLVEALFQLRTKADMVREYLRDRDAFCARFDLDEQARKALIDLDEGALRDDLGMHPFLTAGALRHVNMLADKPGR